MTLVSKITAVNGQVRPFCGPQHAPAASRPLLDKLRKAISRIEHREPQFAVTEAPSGIAPGQPSPWNFGLAGIDPHLPRGRLETGAVHEIAGANYGESPAAMGFALALATRLLAIRPGDPRPVLWCRHTPQTHDFGELYSTGLDALGLTCDRLLTTTFGKSRTLLWTAEEALKSGAVAAVIADMDITVCDLTATRRLALTAADAGAPVLLVSGKPPGQATSARTRWRVSAAPSIPPPFDEAAPGEPAWTVELTRCRGGKSGKWSMVWHHATHSFSLASTVSHRTVEHRSHPGRRSAAL
ncbi:MAG: hypothetical protein HKN11_03100 [Rhizobiales bacterium]|nr:hypothetical protein [Hyphomicrobiales bacterium]